MNYTTHLRSVALGLLAALALLAEDENYGRAQIARICSVHDGDTFLADIQGYPPVAGKCMPVRIRGIDAPEIRSRNASVRRRAIRAKEYLEWRLGQAQDIQLWHMQRGDVFWIVADVHVNGEDLATELLEKGFVRKDDGGRKEVWPE